MSEKPILSIVTPTRGNFSAYWLEQLLRVEGAVEFILVYPPGVPTKAISDSRVKTLTSPYKGEMMQRFVALLNASGDYLLALDDDDFVHPEVVKLAAAYFQRFPQSWILRLKKDNIDFKNEDKIKQDWGAIPDLEQLAICKKTSENPYPYQDGNYLGLLEVPVAPLDKSFNLLYAVWPLVGRKDNEGYHFENFNNIVWQNDLVQKALPDLSQATHLMGALTWLPSTGFDRLLGLFVQAKFFEKDRIIGHWLPNPAQIRYIDKDPSLKPPRFHVVSDFLLVKYYPQYGYLWNLFLSKLYGVPRTVGKLAKLKLSKS